MENKKKLFGKKAGTLILFAICLVFSSVQLNAQNVTIRGNNGSTIAAVKNYGTDDTFFAAGGFATWQHEQLNMVLTTADGKNLTSNGQLDNPANNLFVNGEYMQIGKGQGTDANVCYVSISLPKGYRFTKYTITFTKPYNVQKSTTISFNTAYNEKSTFGETGSDFDAYITSPTATSATITTGGEAQTISRSEGAGGSMSNVLYFKLENPTDKRALIQLMNAEFFFTAEENYSPVTPAGAITSPVSAVDVPFPTSRVDFGRIQSQYYQGATRVSYSSANVKDIDGKFVLYEKESTKAGTDIDGISGQIVDYKAGTISSACGYFKLGREDKEQVYYLETPTYVEVSDGTKVPIGYRITEAEFEYAKTVGQRTFYITYYYDRRTYYLGTKGRFSTTQTLWEMDSEGYISNGSGNSKVYLYFNNGYAATQKEKPSSDERFGITNDNVIYQLNWPDYHIKFYRVKTYYGTIYYGLISKDNGNDAKYSEVSNTMETVDDYTLYVYDKEGNNPQEIKVSDSNGSGIVKVKEGLNNDAVKFGVKGIGLVRATLTVQALDPYLDDMSVICQAESQDSVRMSQSFTASDFSVSGGEFYFYLPKDLEGQSVKITFEDLHSKYFDETYKGGHSDNNARLNFVKSDHYNVFGESSNNIYSNTAEAANAQKERQKVGIVGTSKFKFNNADEVGSSGGVLKEYAFSLENYAKSPNNGSFDEMKFTVSSSDQNLVRYVFTTDETRYNIAPTTATQHRAYAFYEMNVHVQSQTYEPKVKFVKVYDKTYHGSAQNDAYYGAIVTATDGAGNAGYSSAAEIFKHINRAIENKKDDFGNTDVPADQKYILYLDFSSMKGVYQTIDDEHSGMEDFSAGNAANALVFLPYGSSAQNDNVAVETGTKGLFNAVRDIVLTDKEPFYTPYDIEVPEAQKVIHERSVTNGKNGKVTSATIIMPFAIRLDDDGNHINVRETTAAFSLHTMQPNNCISKDAPEGTPEESVASYAFFPNIQNQLVTEPNKPYIVKVLNPSEGDKTSFVITQNGTRIENSKKMDNTDYTFTGETANGTLDGKSYTFTNKGTFSGIQLPKHDGYYYFAQNKFVCSNDLDDRWETVGVYPFRAYYSTGTSHATLMSTFAIVFGEGNGVSDPTGIKNVGESADLVVAPGVGVITMASTVNQGVNVYNMNGVLVESMSLGAGETQSISVPAGMYIVNNTKIVVR